MLGSIAEKFEMTRQGNLVLILRQIYWPHRKVCALNYSNGERSANICLCLASLMTL